MELPKTSRSRYRRAATSRGIGIPMAGAVHILDGLGGVLRTIADPRDLVRELGVFLPSNDNPHPDHGPDVETIAAMAGYCCSRVSASTPFARVGDFLWWMEAPG